MIRAHDQGWQLSDRHTPMLGLRGLDLVHIVAALVLEAKILFSIDDHQRKAAESEGLKVKP